MPITFDANRVLLYIYNCRYSEVPAVRNLMRNVMQTRDQPQPQLQPPATGETPAQPQRRRMKPPPIGAKPAQPQAQLQPLAVGAQPKAEPRS
jgi:hypothetical protein